VRTLRFPVGFPAGGGADTVVRIIAPWFPEKLGQGSRRKSARRNSALILRPNPRSGFCVRIREMGQGGEVRRHQGGVNVCLGTHTRGRRVFKKELAPREWARTTDLTVNSRPLYQLSYRGMERADGFEPPSSSG
jgi:hypothetical protein